MAIDQIVKKGVVHEIVPEIAPLFSTSTAYAVGDCVIKDAVLYRFKTAHSAGAWSASEVEAITVGKELTELNERLRLLVDDVPNTVQTYTFTNGSVSKVEHKNGNTLIRSDVFAYSETTITETRTLNTGDVLTIVTNLTTLETTVTYTAA